MADTTSNTSFLSLPAELRQEIYSHLWGSEIIGFSIPNGSAVFAPPDLTHLVYCGSSRTAKNLPQWLIASKQVCREGLDELCRNREITARSWGGRGDCPNSLILPLIPTVVIETIGGCWHADPPEEPHRAFKIEDHDRLHARLHFPNYVQEDATTRVDRKFYFTLDKSHVKLLQSLFTLGAPIREIRMMTCLEKGMIAAKNYYATCRSEEYMVTELPASLRSDIAQTAMLFEDENWQVELIEKEPLDKGSSHAFNFNFTVDLRWTKKHDI